MLPVHGCTDALWLFSPQTRFTGASCLVPAALASLNSPWLLGDVALEAARLSRCGRRRHLSHREVLLAMELVLLQELCKLPAGSSSWELLLRGPGRRGQS